ncbi:MAG: DUF6886 family protein [Ilumatobacteraceae bacterium]
MTPTVLHHFSEDPSITRFVPHVPRTNPEHRRAVWAIDGEHAPLYWFPRDCPRVTIWPLRTDDVGEFQTRLATTAGRVHAIESGWLERMRSTPIYRYDFDPEGFYSWEEANGQWIAECDVVPAAVAPVGDLPDAHARAGIELRIVPSRWPLHDWALERRFDFSIVRMHNARPRHERPGD